MTARLLPLPVKTLQQGWSAARVHSHLHAHFATALFHLTWAAVAVAAADYVCCARLTRPYAVVCVSSMIASVFAAPLAAGLMSLDQQGGLAGWQVGGRRRMLSHDGYILVVCEAPCAVLVHVC
jgi:hypothetical protein